MKKILIMGYWWRDVSLLIFMNNKRWPLWWAWFGHTAGAAGHHMFCEAKKKKMGPMAFVILWMREDSGSIVVVYSENLFDWADKAGFPKVERARGCSED
jgi:hypothetical protein